MCSAREAREREACREVAPFETLDARARPRRVSLALAVKRYRRCAAGVQLGQAAELRTRDALRKTVRHLLGVVLTTASLPPASEPVAVPLWERCHFGSLDHLDSCFFSIGRQNSDLGAIQPQK